MLEFIRSATDSQIAWAVAIFLVIQLASIGALARKTYTNHRLKDDLRAYYRMKQSVEKLPRAVRRNIKYSSIYE